jgi:hypothetical protein
LLDIVSCYIGDLDLGARRAGRQLAAAGSWWSWWLVVGSWSSVVGCRLSVWSVVVVDCGLWTEMEMGMGIGMGGAVD